MKKNAADTRRRPEGGMFRTAVLLLLMAGAWHGQAFAQTTAEPAVSLRLVGTIESGPFTGAVFDDAKGQQVFYRLNEQLPDGARIVNVQSDHIILKWPDGTRRQVFSAPGGEPRR